MLHDLTFNPINLKLCNVVLCRGNCGFDSSKVFHSLAQNLLRLRTPLNLPCQGADAVDVSLQTKRYVYFAKQASL